MARSSGSRLRILNRLLLWPPIPSILIALWVAVLALDPAPPTAANLVAVASAIAYLGITLIYQSYLRRSPTSSQLDRRSIMVILLSATAGMIAGIVGIVSVGLVGILLGAAIAVVIAVAVRWVISDPSSYIAGWSIARIVLIIAIPSALALTVMAAALALTARA